MLKFPTHLTQNPPVGWPNTDHYILTFLHVRQQPHFINAPHPPEKPVLTTTMPKLKSFGLDEIGRRRTAKKRKKCVVNAHKITS